jgi:Fic family protein
VKPFTEDDEMRMHPDGTVEGTPEEVAAFKHIDAALAAKNGRITRSKQKPEVVEVEEIPISAKLNATLNMLQDNDIVDGISADEMGKWLGVPRATATWRLRKLEDLGLAHRVKRGHYRPGELKYD